MSYTVPDIQGTVVNKIVTEGSYVLYAYITQTTHKPQL